MDNITLYKQLTLDIIECLEKDNIDNLEELFEKRQSILDKENNNKSFKANMIESGIIELDNNIKDLLQKNIIKTKIEIKNQKISSVANNCYINFSKENLNIFNKKV